MDARQRQGGRARRGSPAQLLRALLVLNRRRLLRTGRGLLNRWPGPVNARARAYDSAVPADSTPDATAPG